MAGNCRDTQTEIAMKMNSFYASKYHTKFPFIDTDEFISVGLVAIARVLNVWKYKKKNNFQGYIKNALQNEYRLELKKVKIQREIISEISIAGRSRIILK